MVREEDRIQHLSYEHQSCGGEQSRHIARIVCRCWVQKALQGTFVVSGPKRIPQSAFIIRASSMRWGASGGHMARIATPFPGAKNKRTRRVPWVSSSSADDAPPARATEGKRHIHLACNSDGGGGRISWSQAHTAISTNHTSTSMRWGASDGHMARIVCRYRAQRAVRGTFFVSRQLANLRRGRGKTRKSAHITLSRGCSSRRCMRW